MFTLKTEPKASEFYVAKYWCLRSQSWVQIGRTHATEKAAIYAATVAHESGKVDISPVADVVVDHVVKVGKKITQNTVWKKSGWPLKG